MKNIKKTTLIKKYLMRKITLLFLFLFLLPNVFANIIINEIMYNPTSIQGGDDYSEWVELYNNGSGSINISGWKICNDNLLDGYVNYSDKNIYLNNNMIIPTNSYVIITDGDSGTKAYDYFNISNTSIALHTDASSICDRLSNSGETVSLYDSSSILIDQVNYADIAEEGYSIESVNDSWQPSLILGGTPGYENSISQGITPPAEETKNIILETYLDEIIYMNTKYTKLFKIKIENKDSCSEKDTITVSYTITNPNLIKQDEFTKEVGCSGYASTGEFTPTLSGNYALCGKIIDSTINETYPSDNSACMNFAVIDTSSIPCNISLNITTDQEIYIEGTSIKFYNNLNNEEFPYIIEYWIEDFFGNIYKNKYNTTNTNQKSWKTNIAEQDRVLFIKSIVYPNCNDSNSSDNSAEKMFIVKGSDDSAANRKESSLEIIEVDDKAKFGDILDVKVNIYKGNTNKYSISLWVEDNGEKISETTKIHLYDKYSSYYGQLPINLDSNCNQELEDGKYDVVIKGLDKEDKKEIKIEGIKTSACSTSSTKTTSSSTRSKKFEYEIIDFSDKVDNNELNAKVKLTNNDDEDCNIKIWSYVYRGSKCYSGNREDNKKETLLTARTSEIINLKNIIDADPGEYKYKVVINKDNQKTNKELIEDIVIEDKAKEEKYTTIEKDSEGTLLESEKENIITPAAIYKLKLQSKTIYESVDEKIKKLTFIFLITLSIFLNIILIWRR